MSTVVKDRLYVIVPKKIRNFFQKVGSNLVSIFSKNKMSNKTSFPFFAHGYPLWCTYGQQNVVVVPRRKKGCDDVIADGFDFNTAVVAGHLKPKVQPITNGLLVARENPKAPWTRAAFIDDFQAQLIDGVGLLPIIVNDGIPFPKEIRERGGRIFGGLASVEVETIGEVPLGHSVIVIDPPSTVIRKRRITDQEMGSALKKMRTKMDALIEEIDQD